MYYYYYCPSSPRVCWRRDPPKRTETPYSSPSSHAIIKYIYRESIHPSIHITSHRLTSQSK